MLAPFASMQLESDSLPFENPSRFNRSEICSRPRTAFRSACASLHASGEGALVLLPAPQLKEERTFPGPGSEAKPSGTEPGSQRNELRSSIRFD